MQTKLTLRLEEKIVRQAKSYADQQGKSISKMVSDFFSLIHETLRKPSREQLSGLTPLVQSLKGALRKARVSVQDYRRHLEEKHL